MSIGRWADAAGHPSGASLRSAGYIGVFVYVGTAGRSKNCTHAIYADYIAHGLQVIGVYEDGTHDIASGQGAGHARSAMADMLAIGMPRTTPLCAAADEHLTAAQVRTAITYQGDFYRTCKNAGWVGKIGGYGFVEFTRAVSAAGVADWLWQAGSPSVLWPGVHFWQRNDGMPIVDGTQIDISEQYLAIVALAASTLEEDPVQLSAGINRSTVVDIPAGKTKLVINVPTGNMIVHAIYFAGDNYPYDDRSKFDWKGSVETDTQIDALRPWIIDLPTKAPGATNLSIFWTLEDTGRDGSLSFR